MLCDVLLELNPQSLMVANSFRWRSLYALDAKQTSLISTYRFSGNEDKARSD